MNIQAKNLEHTLVEFIRGLREQFADVNAEAFQFIIDVTGRTSTGDVKIEFSLDHLYKTGVKASGGNLAATVDEFIRRIDWKEVNAPLCLPNVEPTSPAFPSSSDEIPF